MQPQCWDEVELEVLSDKIRRQVVHGAMATVARFHLSKGAMVGRHAHVNEQVSSVVRGALRLEFDDRDVVVGPGQMIVIPPNVPHAAHAVEECEVIDFFAPRREDWIRKDDAYLRR